MLRGLAARILRRDTSRFDLDDDGGFPPSSLVVVQAAHPADDAAKHECIEREPVDDLGNYYAWPDDPDEVPDWIVRAETWRAAAGITDRLPARTRREFWQQLEMATIASDDEVVIKAPPQAALSPIDAAREFLDDLMSEANQLGEPLHLGVADLAARYESHCARENRVPCAIEQMKGKLARLPGCTRTKADERRNGRRYRPVVWIIDPETAAIVESVSGSIDDVVQFRMAA